MSQEIKVIAKDAKSANITMTDEYLVVKGLHYNIFNGYVSRTEQNKAIHMKDILNVEYVPMHSKRLFILFVFLMSIVMAGIPLIRSLLNTARKNRKILEKGYEILSNGDGSIAIGAIKIVVTIYILLVILSILVLLVYCFKPYYFLRFSAVGAMIAVETKYYKNEELYALSEMWEKQMSEKYL